MTRLISGLIKELRPLPVIATLTAVYLGFLLAEVPWTDQITLFFISVFFGLYTVNFLDTYEDSFIRKEDEYKKFTLAHGASGLLKKNELIVGSLVCSILFFVSAIFVSSNLVFFSLTIGSFLVGISYSHYLSKNLFFSLLAYPTAVFLVMADAYLLALGNSFAWVLAYQLIPYFIPVFLLFLASKSWVDIADSDTDKKSGRSNIGILLGNGNAKKFCLFFLIAGIGIAAISFSNLFFYIFSFLLLLVFYFGYKLPAKDGAKYIVIGTYIFLIAEIIYFVSH